MNNHSEPISTTSRLDLLTGRYKLAYQLRQKGLTFREIGRQMGVGYGRANQMYRSAERILNRVPHWTDGLSVRAANCLNNCEINSREETLSAYNSGKLHAGKGGPRNYGWKTHKEVAKWLGLTEPKKPTPRVFVSNQCPHCGRKLI